MRTRAFFVVAALTSVALVPTLSRPAGGATDVAGVPAAQVGDHGPLNDFIAGQFQLVGHADMTPHGGTKPLGNNGGIALIGDCAYVGRWHDYSGTNAIQIVDVANPANPHIVGGVPGSAITDAVAREIRAIDLPGGFKMLTVMTFAKYLDSGLITAGQNAFHFYLFPSGNCRNPVLAGTFDTRPFRGHEFFQWIDPNPVHSVAGHPRIIEYLSTPLSGTDIVVIDASKPAKAKFIGVYNAGIIGLSLKEANLDPSLFFGYGKYTHSISISPDGTKAYISHWDGGFFTADTSAIAGKSPVALIRPAGLSTLPLNYRPKGIGNTHSAVLVPGSKKTMVVADEIYVSNGGCPFGWMHMIDGGGLLAKPKQLAQFRLPENLKSNCGSDGLVNDRNASGKRIDGSFSIHNQTATRHYVLASWYGGGLRAIDITNSAAPHEIATFVPKPVDDISSVPDTPAPIYGKTAATDDDWWVSTWSYPIVRNGLIYVSDVRSGLYILRATPGSALAADIAGIGFLEGNSNLGDFIAP